MFSLKLDGNPTQSKVLGLDRATITLRRDEKGKKVFSFSSELTFLKGQDYDYIKAKLIDDPNAIQNVIKVTVTDDCCDKTYEFKIDAEHIEWCEGICNITTNLIEFNENTKAYDCVDSTLIWDNHDGFMSRQHPRITYCNELRPDILQHFIMIAAIILTVALFPILLPILLIAQTINLLIAAANQIPGVSLTPIGDGDVNIFDDVKDWFRQIILFAVGCGRKHPSPFVRHYVENVCKKCGISFQSSILNDSASPYYNTMYFSAPVRKGVAFDNTTQFYIDENKPLLTGSGLLDEQKQLYNGDWRIITTSTGSVLIFQRRDFFINTNPWLDTADLTDSQLISLCFNWTQKQRPAFGNFQYQMDAIDWVGNEAKARWNDIVEWNQPFSPLQKGEKKVVLPYSPARFRDDGLDQDVLATYDSLPFFGFIKNYTGVMIMHSGTSFTPKILIWDENSSISDARVKKGYNTPTVPSSASYNAPLWFDELIDGGLYDSFWEIENPKLQAFQGKDFTLKLRYNCEIVSDMDIDRPITVDGFPGQINTIEIRSHEQIMEIKGFI